MSTEVTYEIPEADASPPPPTAPKNGKGAVKSGKAFRASTPSSEETDVDMIDAGMIKDWLSGLGGQTEIKVNISRLKPMIATNGVQVGGSLETVEEIIDEEYIRSTWGGGVFLLRVYTPSKKGNGFSYYKGRQIKIAGHPKMEGVVQAKGDALPFQPAPISESSSVVDKAMEMQERAAQRAEARADALESRRGNNGLDIETIRAFTGPLESANAALREEIAELRQTLAQPPQRDELRDELIKTAVQGEGKRIETLREQYEARIDKMRDSHEDQLKRTTDAHREDLKRLEDRLLRAEERHNDAIKRLEERHRDEVKRIEDRHTRDLALSDKTSDQRKEDSKLAFDARLDAKNSEIAKLERDLNAAMTKISTLESIKQQTMGDKIEEIVKLREGLDGIGGGESEESWWEKAIGALGNLPVVTNLIEKATGGAPPQNVQQSPQQQPPPGVPFQGPDGNIYVFDNAGNMRQLTQEQLQRLQAHQAAQQRALAGGAPPSAKRKKRPQAPANDQAVEQGLADGSQPAPETVGRQPTQAEMDAAIAFIENTLKSNNPDPANFASSARVMIDGEILAYLRAVGFDKFLASANIKPGSPLTTQRGKNFLRNVYRALFEGGSAVETEKD